MKSTIARRLTIWGAVIVSLAQTAQAGKTVYNANLVNGPVASTQSYTLNVSNTPNANGINAVAAQVIYSSVALPTDTFKDGSQSSGTITVNSSAVLLAAPATNQITVPATSAILGSAATAQFTVITTTGLGSGATAQITITSTSSLVNPLITITGSGSAAFLAGTNWFQLGTTSATAQSLASIINFYSTVTGVSAAWGGGSSNVVYCSATVNGIQTNSYSVTSSTYNGIIATTTFSGGLAPGYVTVNGNVLTNGIQWSVQSTSSGTAASLATAVNAIGGVQAAWGGGTSTVVYASATVNGTAGNSFTLGTSAAGSISTSSTNFMGGANRALQGASIKLNGVTTYNGYGWTDASNTSTGTALSIAAWMNSASGVIQATAPVNSSVIYATTSVSGTAGNGFTLSSTGLTVAGATFSGGLNNASVTINGVTLTAGVNFSTGTTAATATALVAAIQANTALNAALTVSAVSNVVSATSTAIGTATNYGWSSSNTTGISVSGTGMTGGANPAWTINQPVINIPAHGYATGLGVWLSSAGPIIQYSTVPVGGTPTTLAQNTTYYVIAIDTNNIELALTSTGAVAGAYLTLVSSSNTGPHTYTLNQSTFTATGEILSWWVSNTTNCSSASAVYSSLSATKYGVSVPTTTISSFVYPNASAIWDLGEIDFQCLQLRIGGPTAGEINVQAIINGRD